MIEAKTILLQTEIAEARNVICYFMRIVYENGVEIGRAKNPHVVNFTPDSNPAALFAETNNDITTRNDMLWPAISSDEWARATAHCAVEHTPAVKAAYQAWKARASR